MQARAYFRDLGSEMPYVDGIIPPVRRKLRYQRMDDNLIFFS